METNASWLLAQRQSSCPKVFKWRECVYEGPAHQINGDQDVRQYPAARTLVRTERKLVPCAQVALLDVRAPRVRDSFVGTMGAD